MFPRLRGKYYHAVWWEGHGKNRFQNSASLKVTTEREAWREIEKLEARQREERREKATTWATFCEIYKRDYSLTNKVKESQDRDDITIAHFNAICSINILSDLRPSHLEAYKVARAQLGRKESTINRELNTLKSITARAIEWKYLKEDPWKIVSKFEAHQTAPETLYGREKRLYKACTDAYDRVLCNLGLKAGLRRGEMANLKWEDIDFKKDIIRVVSTHGRRTKTKKERYLPLHQELKKDLVQLERERDCDFVLGRNGEQTLPDYLSARFHQLTTWADIKGHLHLTRHTFLTKLADTGTDIKTIMDLAGHSRMTTTQIYIHPNAEMKRRAVDRI